MKRIGIRPGVYLLVVIGSVFLLTACGTAETEAFTVTLQTGEDEPERLTIAEGDSLELPEMTPEEGRLFMGWKEEGGEDAFTVLEDVDRDHVLVPVFSTHVEAHFRENLLDWLIDLSFDLDEPFKVTSMETRAIQGLGYHEDGPASIYMHVSFMRITTGDGKEHFVIDHRAKGVLGDDAFSYPVPEAHEDVFRIWDIFVDEEEYHELKAEWDEEMDLQLAEAEEFFDDDPIILDKLKFTVSEDDLEGLTADLASLWEQQFTISFDTGAAEDIPDKQVGFGGTIVLPEVEIGGYHLEGVYLDSDFEKRFDTSMRVQDSLTLYYNFVSYEDLLEEEVTLTVWHAFGPLNEALLQELFDEFEKLHPQVTIEQEAKGTYSDLRRAVIEGVVAGTTPDIVIDEPQNLADYLVGHALVPLDDYIHHESFGIDTDDLIFDFFAESQSLAPQGGTYALPFAKTPEVLYYNKTVFDHFGIEFAPEEALTWEEIAFYADKIEWTPAAKDALVDSERRKDFETPHLVTAASAERLFLSSLRQWGSPLTTPEGDIVIDDAVMGDVLHYFDDLFTDDTLSLPSAWDESHSFIPFTEGRTLMSQDWGAAPHLHIPEGDSLFGDFEVGIIPVIQKHAEGEGPRAVNYRGLSLAMFTDTTDAERLAGWFLMDFLTATEENALFAEKTGYIPIRQSAYATDYFQEMLDLASLHEAGQELDVGQEEILRALVIRAAYEQMDDYAFDPAFYGRIVAREAHRQAGIVFGHFYAGLRSAEETIEELRERLES